MTTFDVYTQDVTCPICNRTWRISMYDDCMVPACGCYGSFPPETASVPCHSCGTRHAFQCMSGRDDWNGKTVHLGADVEVDE